MIEQTKSIADPAVVQKIADQRIMDSMQVSAGVAEEMRRKIFQYAAEQVKTDTAQFRDLLYYGGVK